MVSLRSRRLETLLGARIEDVTFAQVSDLVSNQVVEAYDLDFKAQLYGRTDSDKRDLATDVAALANTAGGLIVIGIDEDDQARAAAVSTVPLSDTETARMQQIVASLTAPLPDFDIVAVEDRANSGTGFLLIAVPPSQRQPHAVIVNQGLRFPRRNGSTTRYLSESEVATAYRDRFAAVGAQFARAEEVEQHLLVRLVTDHLPWIVVSLVPDLAGDFIIDAAALNTFRDGLINTDPLLIPAGIAWQRVRVGRRRLVADGTIGEGEAARWVAAELHQDGSGAFAVVVPDLNQTQGPLSDPGRVRRIEDESAVIAVMSGLHLLARHARDRAAAGGNALLRVQIFPISAESQVQLGHQRGFANMGGTLGTQTLAEPLPASEYVASLDSITDVGPEIAAAACLLFTDFAQAFGYPEVLQLTRDGQFRRKYWSEPRQQAIQAWAAAGKVAVIDDTLPST